MAIKITLASEHTWNTELLEKLEDRLRTLLIDMLEEGFEIEDEYTGNSLSPYGGKSDV